MKSFLGKINWIKTAPVIAASLLLLWAVGCQPTVQSILNPSTKVTAETLQLELNTILAQYEIRKASLEQQQQLRDLLLNNALLITQTGSVNPLGIITGLLAFYGIGSAANDTKKAVKRLTTKS